MSGSDVDSCNPLFSSKFENDFVIKRRLGEETPSLGKVFLVSRKNDLIAESAVKAIKLLNFDEKTAREVKILKTLNHSNIVKYYDSWEEKPPDNFRYQHLSSGGTVYSFIEMEACLCGDLTDWLKINPNSFEEKAHIFQQIVEGIVYIHSHGIIHRDIKPGNIFLKRENERIIAKVGDLGLATILKTTMTSRRGTEYYWSPEISKEGCKHYCAKTDVYSLGMVYFEMLAGISPTDWSDWKIKMVNVREHQFPYIFGTENLQQQEKLIRLMLQKNPHERRSAAEVKNWVQGVEYYKDETLKFGKLNDSTVAVTFCYTEIVGTKFTEWIRESTNIENICLKFVTFSGEFRPVFLPKLKRFYFEFTSNAQIVQELQTVSQKLKSVLFFQTVAGKDWKLSGIWGLCIDICIFTRTLRLLEINHKNNEVIVNLDFAKELLPSTAQLQGLSKLSLACCNDCNLTHICDSLSYLNLHNSNFSFESIKANFHLLQNLSEFYLHDRVWKQFDLSILPRNLNILYVNNSTIITSIVGTKVALKSASFENCILPENLFTEILSAKKLAIFNDDRTWFLSYKPNQKTVNGIFQNFSTDSFDWVYIDGILPHAWSSVERRLMSFFSQGSSKQDLDQIESILHNSGMKLYDKRILIEKNARNWQSMTVDVTMRNSLRHKMSGYCKYFYKDVI